MANFDRAAVAFVSGIGPTKQGNLIVTPDTAYTYNVKLAERTDDGFIVNMETYSTTSSAHRGAIVRELERRGYVKKRPRPEGLSVTHELYTRGW